MSLTSVRIRTAGIEDLPELQEIENGCFRDERYSVNVLMAMLAEKGFVTLIAEEGGPLGAVTINYRPDLVAAQLVSLAVLPYHRGRGIATALLAEAEGRAQAQGADRMVLQVGVVNVAAINLYLHRGYILEGMIGDYYGPGRDAYFMTKVL
jgi:ribosomal-protein-alanine N-acetyltransferase